MTGAEVSRATRGDDDPDDAEVVRRVRGGEVDLFRVLVRRYGDPLFRHAERMTGRPDVAADLVQTAFVQGFRKLDRCDPDHVGGWLFRILVNLTRDHFRDPRRKAVPLERVRASADPAPGPAEVLDRSELGRMLDAALARIPEEQREAFVMKHHEGYSYREMAELLGTSTGALKMRVHRARDALRSILEGEA